jgi:hypothetical protein
METIALFPLSSVLLPGGRMPLQIFEARYLDLVSECMKTDSGFGVLLLRQGREVVGSTPLNENRLAQLGTYATIVDWNPLPNGMLGITIEGQKKFRLLSTSVLPNNLYTGQVEWLQTEPRVALPQQAAELTALVRQLTEHPHVKHLKINAQIEDAGTLGCVLTQLLPIDEQIKFDLLACDEPMVRLELIMELLDDMGN